MPILKEEKSIYPENLFNEQYQEERREEGARWWAVYTMSRREKELMRRLLPKQVPFFCPIIGVPKRSPQGRVRTTFSPLFSNYVFIHATEDERIQALQTNCISKCLEVKEEEKLVFDLSQVHTLISSKQELRHESRLEVGTPVRIKSGPFEGIKGEIVERRSEARLLIAVNYLQQGTSIAIKDFEVEKV
ncbi:transcription termination/antitermination NusG family protein [Thalassoglobus sp.]|uniref:transcription termination/antitermination NusG family protein n=1 Tax=Thalassoglobus sp. TaxID=2795869 RepID=UPI003AA82765